MSEIDRIKKELEEAEKILVESRKNLEENPGEYSAKLLVMSTENHIADLIKKLDSLKS